MKTTLPDDGRDEMNLAEMPIAFLSSRVPPGVDRLVFEGTHGKLTISGSSAYGLPTCDDSDVILALVQLTRERNGFSDPCVPFTRYEVLKIMGKPDESKYYKRLDESLNRWLGVLLVYEKAWFDARVKARVDAKFHILESVVIYDRKTRASARVKGIDPPASEFVWNGLFFASLRAENLKRLDLGTYFGLRSAISKQMYRHLDKRFHSSETITYKLRDFACGHVGLSPKYSDFDLKRKLDVGISELQGIGFLGKVTFEKKKDRISWITLRRTDRPRPFRLT